MNRSRIELQVIHNNQPITYSSNYDFLYLLQQGLLLALQEQGHLSTIQYRHAEEKLRIQRQRRARNITYKDGEMT